MPPRAVARDQSGATRPDVKKWKKVTLNPGMSGDGRSDSPWYHARISDRSWSPK
jgi:hypothetical protein